MLEEERILWYNIMDLKDIKLNDKIESKKPHACKGNVWQIVRVGADYKIKCEKCSRVVMLTPDELRKIIKKVL